MRPVTVVCCTCRPLWELSRKIIQKAIDSASNASFFSFLFFYFFFLFFIGSQFRGDPLQVCKRINSGRSPNIWPKPADSDLHGGRRAIPIRSRKSCSVWPPRGASHLAATVTSRGRREEKGNSGRKQGNGCSGMSGTRLNPGQQ